MIRTMTQTDEIQRRLDRLAVRREDLQAEMAGCYDTPRLEEIDGELARIATLAGRLYLKRDRIQRPHIDR